jgi:hypothetical protein
MTIDSDLSKRLLIFPSFTGGGKGNVISIPFHVWLNQAFANYTASDYLLNCQGFGICSKIAGPYWDFGDKEGPAEIKRGTKGRTLFVDCYIPISAWIYQTTMGFKQYYSNGLKTSFEELLRYSLKRQWVIDETALRNAFVGVMSEFDARDFTKEAKFLDVDAKNPFGLVL